MQLYYMFMNNLKLFTWKIKHFEFQTDYFENYLIHIHKNIWLRGGIIYILYYYPIRGHILQMNVWYAVFVSVCYVSQK